MPKANSTQYRLFWTTPGSSQYTQILPPDFENLTQARDWINQRVAKYPDDLFYIEENKTDGQGNIISTTVLYNQDTWVG